MERALILIGLLALPSSGQAPRQQAPQTFHCRPNDLTNYTGVVTGYRREAGRTTLRIHTDYETNERVTLAHPGTDDPSAFFRVGGRPFAAGDWALIEQRKGQLRPGVRASIWVCADGQAMVEWRAPRE